MYKGDFKEGSKYETDAGKEITYVGRINNTHYVVNTCDEDKAFAVSDVKLRDCIVKEIKTPKTIIGGNVKIIQRNNTAFMWPEVKEINNEL